MNKLDLLFEKLVGTDEDSRINAGFALHTSGRLALERALRLARSNDAMDREMASFVLGRVLDTSTVQDIVYPTYYRDGVPILVDLLRHDPEPRVRMSAVTALSFHNLPDTLKDICSAAWDHHLFARFGAAQALANLTLNFWDSEEAMSELPIVEQALEHLSEDKNEEIRSWAALAIGHVADKSATLYNLLEKMSRDTGKSVANEAKDSLGRLVARTS